eukprot:scaffold417_cov184-Alexandrium_tamarense.AAC.16
MPPKRRSFVARANNRTTTTRNALASQLRQRQQVRACCFSLANLPRNVTACMKGKGGGWTYCEDS